MKKTELLKRAKEVIDAHKSMYYRNGEYIGADFWDFAEIFEIIEDYYEVSGDESVLTTYNQMYDYVIRTYTADWSSNPFNDDIMWLVIALTRAYLDTGKKEYLDTAISNFHMAYDRSYSEDLGGGLFWRIERQCKNTCVNCPAAIAAQYLAIATKDDCYYDKAKKCIDWAVQMMFEPSTGKVYDSIDLNGSVNKWSSTYNQGTFIGACMMYYEKTGNAAYFDYAEHAADYVMNEMYHSEIMDNEESGNDLPGFKGILSRYIRRFANATGKVEYLNWLRKNADSCYAGRNSKGIMWTQLSHKTEERDDYDVFAVSAAVSVVVNAVG